MAPRVGIDLVSVESVRESIDEHGDRYLKRIYNESELSDCHTPQGIVAERLAARFAAKEATLKVLRPVDEAIPWRTIEVVRHGAGWVEVELSGRAAELGRRGRPERFRAQHLPRGGLCIGHRDRRAGLEESTQRSDRENVIEDIRKIIAEHGRLPVDVAGLAPDADLYHAGMTSHASVNVMLALEDHFDIEFPDRMLKRSVFESISAIEQALNELRAEQPVS